MTVLRKLLKGGRWCLVSMLLLLGQWMYAQDVVVIVNSSVNVSGVSKDDIGDVFLGKKSKISGASVSFAILEDDALHGLFLKGFVGKNARQFKNFWKKQVFTGMGSMPEEIDNEDAMLAWVKNTPGAIGYLSESKANAEDLSSVCSVIK